MARGRVLVVESEPRGSGVAALRGEHVDARGVATLSAALAEIDAGYVDVVVLDAAASSSEPLVEVIRRFGDVPVVVADQGGTRQAVLAMRSGAADFVEKPYEPKELSFVVKKILGAIRAREDVPETATLEGSGLLGGSRAMSHVLDLVRRVATGNATALVRGESGTGKELVARALHAGSSRAEGPFVKVHCAALPDALLESELFGYEKGAFTGATQRKPGRAEIAEGGTLFLDEIGDITPAIQVKLLRLLQDREYERLGGTTTEKADVRFVAATHRDLEHMVEKGEFREDLFYRLNVVPIWLPPLRARRDDVALLARHFCDAFAQAHGKPQVSLSDAAVEALRSERWPGNVRQLQNFVERLVVLSEGKAISAEDVKVELAPHAAFVTQVTGAGDAGRTVDGPVSGNVGPASTVTPLDAAVGDAERRAIERALRHADGNRTLAARLLGVSRAHLYTKLEEHGITPRKSG